MSVSRGGAGNSHRTGAVRRRLSSRAPGRRRREAHEGGPIAGLLTRPRVGWGVLISVVFAAASTALAVWVMGRPMVAVGRVMDRTWVVRQSLAVEDETATDQERERARQKTPRVFVADQNVLDDIRTSLENLPRTLSGVSAVEQVDAGIREQFRLTPAMLAAVQAEVRDGQAGPGWMGKVKELAGLLARRPLLDEQTWQRATQEGLHHEVRLVVGGAETTIDRRGKALVNVADAGALAETASALAQAAGFTGPAQALVVNRLTQGARATFREDPSATALAQKKAADGVRPVIREHPAGQVVFRAGEMLTPAQADLYRAELSAYRAGLSPAARWLQGAGVGGAVGAVTLALAGYTGLFCPRIRRNPMRMAGSAVLLLVALAASCVGTAWSPGLAALTVTAPCVFVAVIMAITYDQRVALAYGSLHALLVCLVLDQAVGAFAVALAGVGAAAWQLREVRDRNALFRMSMVSGLSMAAMTLLTRMVERPMTGVFLREGLIDAGYTVAGAVAVGGVTLFLLPTIERVLDISTGLTLIELRDPKQPLLRELLERAPGTYNHSLNVASLSEAAADAIGADGLLTYVGALYHDIGKMNKPDYFVENQAPGFNRHDRLSPAMSLLVIVGHVKDGLALAREYGLPRGIQHFIESHHGTTLVEFFYHRARQQAARQAREARRAGADAADEPDAPEEFEYRYPGPKPHTREAAVVMLADTCESAARAMPDPTPGKIEALVRAAANKRLLDGQFDDCDLTLRELQVVCESIARSLSSIHHARIAYPRGEAPEQAPDAAPSASSAAGS